MGRGVDRMGSVSWRVGSAEQEHFVLLSKLKAKRLKKSMIKHGLFITVPNGWVTCWDLGD